LRERLDRFFSQWQSTVKRFPGRWRILDGRFLVVLREPEGAEVSGCKHLIPWWEEVKQLERELDTRLLDLSRIFYRNAEGTVESVNRLEFKALAGEGRHPSRYGSLRYHLDTTSPICARACSPSP